MTPYCAASDLCAKLAAKVTGVASVPFSIPNLYGGFATARGILRLEPEHLVLEFDVRDELIGMFNSSVSQARVPLAEVESLEVSARLWRTTLAIRTASMASIADVPGRSQEGVRLSIARKYREDARMLASEVELRIAELRLGEIDERM